MGLFSSKQIISRSLELVVDVGSDAVTASLVSFLHSDHKAKPRVMFTATERIAGMLNDISLLEHHMQAALDKVLEGVGKSNLGIPAAIHCFLHAPWSASHTRIIKLAKNTPFVFTHALAADLVDRELFLLGKEILPQVGQDAEIIEHKTVSIMLNGYQAEHPFGKSATEAHIHLYTAFAEGKLLKQLRESFSRSYGERDVEFHSSLISFFVAVRDLESRTPDRLILEVGGDLSELSLVRDDYLINSVSFPFGAHTLLARMDSPQAESLLSLHQSNKSDPASSRHVMHGLASAEEKWKDVFHAALEELKDTFGVPNHVSIIAPVKVGAAFKNFVENQEYAHHTLTGKNFNAILIDVQKAFQFVALTDHAAPVPAIALHSLFISRSHLL